MWAGAYVSSRSGGRAICARGRASAEMSFTALQTRVGCRADWCILVLSCGGDGIQRAPSRGRRSWRVLDSTVVRDFRFAGYVLLAAFCVHCGGSSSGDTHQVDDPGPSPDAGRGQAGSAGAAGSSGTGNGGTPWNDTGGAMGQSGSSGAGAGGTPVTSNGGSAGELATGDASTGDGLDGAVAPTCQNQSPQTDGARCFATGLRCGHGCTICTCEALPGGGQQWKCVALVC